jgi:hypothetical protein
MRIGILGSGNVGGRLGQSWAALGHTVVFGVRDPHSPKAQAALQAAPGTRLASFAEAAAFGDVVVLAVGWGGVAETLAAAGDLHGKVLIDCTNRLAPPGPGEAGSAGETVAQWALGARVVKAFNTLGAEHLLQPRFGVEAASMFICGDDAEAKRVVGELAGALGFEVVDAGALSAAGLVEGLARLWIHLGHQAGGREIAFRLLRR